MNIYLKSHKLLYNLYIIFYIIFFLVEIQHFYSFMYSFICITPLKPRERAQTAGHKSFPGTGTRVAFNILTLIILMSSNSCRSLLHFTFLYHILFYTVDHIGEFLPFF